MQTNRKILTYIFTLVSLLILTACNDKKVEENKIEIKEVEKVKVDVHTIKKEAYPIWVDFSGKTEAKNNVFITAKVAGELKEIYFQAGQSVQEGQNLFRIDDRSYSAILSQKKSSLQKNKASLNLAIANVNRYKPLVQKGLAPREKLDELVASQKQLEAIVNEDLATIKEAQVDVDDTIIKASISGKLGKSLIDIGNNVSTSDKLVNIVQAEELYVKAEKDAKDRYDSYVRMADMKY